jgi:HSP20 family protein
MVNTLIPLSRIDSVLDGFFGSRCAPSRPLSQSRDSFQPRADVLIGEKDYLIRLDLPGVTREGLDINVEDQKLTVKAERLLAPAEGYQARHRELPEKMVFERTFNLGRDVDPDKIGAKLENGILTVTVPKSDTALPRRIEVQ